MTKGRLEVKQLTDRTEIEWQVSEAADLGLQSLSVSSHPRTARPSLQVIEQLLNA